MTTTIEAPADTRTQLLDQLNAIACRSVVDERNAPDPDQLRSLLWELNIDRAVYAQFVRKLRERHSQVAGAERRRAAGEELEKMHEQRVKIEAECQARVDALERELKLAWQPLQQHHAETAERRRELEHLSRRPHDQIDLQATADPRLAGEIARVGSIINQLESQIAAERKNAEPRRVRVPGNFASHDAVEDAEFLRNEIAAQQSAARRAASHEERNKAEQAARAASHRLGAIEASERKVGELLRQRQEAFDEIEGLKARQYDWRSVAIG